MVKYLIEKGAEVDAVHDHGMTALMWACIKGSLDIAEYLTEKGAEVDARDGNRMTSLMYACINENLNIVEYLREKGAQIDAGDRRGISSLMHACRKRLLNVVKYLIEKGAQINAIDVFGKTALVHACSREKSIEGRFIPRSQQFPVDLNLVQYLIEKGADVNAEDNTGMTALMHVCDEVNEESLEIVKLLIEKGADVDAMDNDGASIMDYDISYEIEEYIRILLLSPLSLKLLTNFKEGNIKNCIQIIDNLEDINLRYDGMNILAHLLVTTSLSSLLEMETSNPWTQQIVILIHFLSKGPKLYDICRNELCYKQYESIMISNKNVSVIDVVFAHFFAQIPHMDTFGYPFKYTDNDITRVLSTLGINPL